MRLQVYVDCALCVGHCRIFLKISVVLPGYILVGQALVRFISEQIYKRSVDDERWIRNSIVLLCGIAVVIFIILFIPLAYIGMGAL